MNLETILTVLKFEHCSFHSTHTKADSKSKHKLHCELPEMREVQMRATKLVITIKNLTYKDRLKRLKLLTLQYRRIRGDMID